MNGLKAVVAAVAVSFSLAGCVTMPELRTVDWAEIDPGPAPAYAETREAVAIALAETLKDPYSAQFRNWSPAYKALFSYDVKAALEPLWAMCVDMNAKNSMGGDVGFKTYYVKLRDGEPIMDAGAFGYAEGKATCDTALADSSRISDSEAAGKGPIGYGPQGPIWDSSGLAAREITRD